MSDDADLGVVCWASCEACETIGLEQMDLPVTFEDAGVDYGVIGFEGAGSFFHCNRSYRCFQHSRAGHQICFRYALGRYYRNQCR